MKIVDLLSQDNYLMYNINLASSLGVYEAIMIGEIARKHNYWMIREELDEDGFFYVTQEDIKKDTGLSEHQQRTASNHLVEIGLLEIKKKGMPAKNFYRINEDVLCSELDIKDVNNKKLKNSRTSGSKIEEQVVQNFNITNTISTNTVNTNTISKDIAKKENNHFLNKEDNRTLKDELKNDSLCGGDTTSGGEKDSSKGYKSLINYINSLSYPNDVKELLLKWYENNAKGRVSVGQLKDKLKKLYDLYPNNMSMIKQSIENSYLNGWMGFFEVKDYKNNNTKKKFGVDSQPNPYKKDNTIYHFTH